MKSDFPILPSLAGCGEMIGKDLGLALKDVDLMPDLQRNRKDLLPHVARVKRSDSSNLKTPWI